MNLPKVSIIIPIFNNKEYYLDTIVSAVYQDYEGEIEIFAIDNESTEMPLSEIKKHVGGIQNQLPPQRTLEVDTVPNVYKYTWHEPTMLGMEKMTGELFHFLGSDDQIQPNFISNNARIFYKNKKIRMVQSALRNIGMRDGYGKIPQYKTLDEFKRIGLERCPVLTPSLVYHRALWDEGRMDGYPEKYFGADDYHRSLRLADEGIIPVPIPKWLGYDYRWHKKQATYFMHTELNSTQTIDKMIQAEFREKWELNND